MLDETALTQLIRNALAEDIGNGDHSTMACIPPTAKGKAQLRIKESGLLAGMEVAEKIFRLLDMFTVFTPFKRDGDLMQPGENAFEVEAAVHTLLMAERLVLNCMQRMSGIATLTHQYVSKLQGYHTRLLDTRKTTPNFRLLEKEAVRIGGGVNHRMGLYDMVMLKDNHIDFAGGITAAVNKTQDYLKQRNLQLQIEVETRNLDDVREVLAVGGIHRIMLDNFKPEQITQALDLINGRYETEASGGITLDNIEAYAKTGVDFVSAGAVIHHAVSLDLSLKAIQ
jgi:nicotinate-nucleotide pyrophosphorylase (carboxylating)